MSEARRLTWDIHWKTLGPKMSSLSGTSSDTGVGGGGGGGEEEKEEEEE